MSDADQTVCHINLAKSYRGGERQSELLVRELARRGWQQRLVCRPQSELLERCLDVSNLTRVQCGSSFVNAGTKIGDSVVSHAHEARAVYASLIGKWMRGVPFVITRRVMRAQKKSWIRDKAYRNAGSVVAVSGAVAAHIRETYPDLEPLVIADAHAELPVDADASAAIRERFAGKTLIVHVGTYDHSSKGQLTIIEAARRASEEKRDWHFLLLGEGVDRERFERAIGTLQNVELTGFVKNVGDYLAAADVFLMPSLHEALGSSILDAIYFGLPIVATRVGGIPEFVEAGVNGTLIEPESVEQLFAGIKLYADDAALVERIGSANRAAAANLGVAQMADRYERVYRSILGSSAP